MITLTSGIINPSFIEEAYTRVCTRRAYNGGWLFNTSGAEHWSPTATIVIVHYASGRTSVHGGEDANTIWNALHGSPAWVDAIFYEKTSLAGEVNVRKEDPDSEYTFDWVQEPLSPLALLLLLCDENIVDKGWLKDVGNDDDVCFQDGNLEVKTSFGWDTVMKCT